MSEGCLIAPCGEPRENAGRYDTKQAGHGPRYEVFWCQAERDFHAQGVPANVSMPDFFRFDLRLLDCDTSPQLETQVLEVTDEFVTFRDHYGYLQTEFRDRQSTPRLLEPPVVTREDWDRKYRELARPGLHRVDLEKRKSEYNEWRRQGRYIALSSLDPFESAWHLVGPDRQLTLMLDDPQWLWEMYEATTDCILGSQDCFPAV